MGQIHGSGAGNWNNAVVVDSSLGTQQGRLYTDTLVTQNVISSDYNSSNTNLVAGGSFVGSSISTLGVNAIQVSLKTDKNCKVYIDQSPDGISWDLVDEYDYYRGINNFGLTTQAINSYFRTRVINQDSTGSTSYFRLQSVLCPIVEALPRSLDSKGNLKVAIKGLSDSYDFSVENTPMGELRVAEPYRLVGTTFVGSIVDSNFWTSALGTGGASVVSGGQITLSVGTTANNVTSLQTLRTGRYVGAHANRFRSIMRIPDTGTVNNVRKWGAFTGSDGAYFKLNGSEFSCNVIKYGTETSVLNGAFNGLLGETYTPSTNVNTWEIYWTNSKVWFVNGDNLIHTFNASGTTWSSILSLPCRFENNNTNGLDSNHDIEVRVATVSRLGRDQTLPTSKYQVGQTSGIVLKYGPGNIHGIVLSAITNNAYATLTDNNTSGGTVIWSTGAMTAQVFPFEIDLHNVPFYSGLTLTMGGANSNVLVIYE